MQDDQHFSNTSGWDPVVRIVHWSLVVFFAVAYWSGGDWLGLHAHAGYCLALVLMVRLIWGWCGSDWARFSDFVVSARQVFTYLCELRVSRKPWRRGHDPAGGWMIVLLLAMLTLTVFTGVILFAMEHRGPLAGTFFANLPGGLTEAVHHFASEATLILIGAHVLGVVFMSWYTRKNLVTSMLSGGSQSDN